MRYRKKPVVIDAVQWEGTDSVKNIKEMQLFLGCKEFDFTPENDYKVETETYIMKLWRSSGSEGCRLYIKTMEGTMEAHSGDYIIKGVKGEFYPCKPDIFEATYEVAE